jgi:hypothetical protein
MMWGGAVSPRLADRSLRKELRHPRLLAGGMVGERPLV